MDLALNNLQKLIIHKTHPTNQSITATFSDRYIKWSTIIDRLRFMITLSSKLCDGETFYVIHDITKIFYETNMSKFSFTWFLTFTDTANSSNGMRNEIILFER